MSDRAFFFPPDSASSLLYSEWLGERGDSRTAALSHTLGLVWQALSLEEKEICMDAAQRGQDELWRRRREEAGVQ